MPALFPFVAALHGLYAGEDIPTGQGLVEYALIIGCLTVALTVALLSLQDQLAEVYASVGDSLAGAPEPKAMSDPKAMKVPNCPPKSNGINCR